MKEHNNEKTMTAQELFDIMLGVEKLSKFYKKHPILYFQLARCNSKTLSCMRFIRQYTAIIRAYEKADRKEAKADRKAAKQYERERKKEQKKKKKEQRASCGTRALHVFFDETLLCGYCGKPVLNRGDGFMHKLGDGEEMLVHHVCHLKMHEKREEERKQ